ncbi:hypothetical protein [Pseudoxanthomonas wuyuanensis]|uniref:hypothetical protein n=1 Tax=Pseudoxanthomonas wuyuanensis TaxID=1073196 RepID=UPI0015967CA4|nr:hypothetical protein [Pseudoxanthomonas wuyuanensis]
MTAYSSKSSWNLVCVVVGVAILVLTINQARLSLATGLLQFSSSKYGFAFFGAEAAAIYLALLSGAGILIGVGWRGLRHLRG